MNMQRPYSKSRDFARTGIDRKYSQREIEERRQKRQARIKKMDARRETRQKFTQGKVLIYFVFFCIIIYFIGYGFMFFSKESIPFDVLQYGSIDEPKTAKGIIVRDETVYTSKANGAVIYTVADKEKVRNGSIICSIKDEASVKELEENLNDINKSIFDMQENRDDLSVFYEDVKKVNLQIKDIVDNTAFNFSILNISEVNDFKSAVQKKIESRNQMLLSENRGSLTELVKKKQNQENVLSKSIQTLSSQSGGIVSYYTDGLENTINVNNMDKITKEQTLMDSEGFDIKTTVVANDRVFKIVNSNEWYIVSYIPNSYIEDWKVNDIVNIYTESATTDGKLSAVINKLDAGEDETYVVLKITKDMFDYIDKRSISFEISRSEVGFKLPLSAVVKKENLKIPKKYCKDGKVIKLTKTSEGIKKEELIIENAGGDKEGKYIYTPPTKNILVLGDEVQNPDNPSDTYMIKEMDNFEGIYIINSGIAEFKTLNTEESSKNSTHIIVKPENNPQIKLYDRVLTETANVEEEVKVYN